MKTLGLHLLLLLAGVLADTVAGPLLVGDRQGVHFSAVAVGLVGLRSGSRWGAISGWMAGIVGASLCGAPLALSAFGLGCAGYVGGVLRRWSSLDLPGIHLLLALVLIFVEEIASGMAGWLALGVSWDPGWLGVGLTLLTISLFPWGRLTRKMDLRI